MKRKLCSALTLIPLLCAFLLCGCASSYHYEAEEDEIRLIIQLDLKEEIGLFLIHYEIFGQEGSGGVSNADKSMIAPDEILDFSILKEQFTDSENEADLQLDFSVLTIYADPNYDDIYPEEYRVYMEPLTLRVSFGNTYHFTIKEDGQNGFKAVWDETWSPDQE